MKILCLDQFGDLGGAQRCLLELLPAMFNRGWSVRVAAPQGPFTQRAAALGAAAEPTVCGPYSCGRKTLADVARMLAEAKPLAGEIRELAAGYGADLIYVNGPRLLPAVALAARNGARVLFHSHNRLGGLSRLAAGRALAMTRAATVASCRYVARPLAAYSGRRGIRVVYNGVREIALARRSPGGPEFRIGMIGRISPEKGQAVLLRAARILHRTSPECRFLICGAPLFSDRAAFRYRAEVEALAEGLPVEFAGWREDVESVMADLDLLVVPSVSNDATPRVIMEAFSAGVPVLAFASGGIPEIIERGVTGFLVEDRSAEALAAGIRDLLREPHRLREAAENARAKARTDFSLDRYRAQMIESIEAAMRA